MPNLTNALPLTTCHNLTLCHLQAVHELLNIMCSIDATVFLFSAIPLAIRQQFEPIKLLSSSNDGDGTPSFGELFPRFWANWRNATAHGRHLESRFEEVSYTHHPSPKRPL